MVPDLMYQDVRDQMFERVLASGPFVQDRTSEETNAVGLFSR